MNKLKNDSIKYKLLSFDELAINIDRLSRLKFPEYSFNRVFTDILTKYLIYPKYSKEEIAKLNDKLIINLVKEIWNKSVLNCCGNELINTVPNQALKLSIQHLFSDIDKRTSSFINAELNFSPILQRINTNNCSNNLKFLSVINKIFNKNKKILLEDLKILREKYFLQFPIEKLVIVEGITEEILLPEYANKLGLNFNKNGIYIIGAGGKSKSPALYTKIKDRLNIPIILMFDKDATDICQNLENFLNKKDKCILLDKGEFEDILSKTHIKRSLNNEYEPATPLTLNELRNHNKMCINIEDFYRTRHLGEYKKSKVAKILSKNLKYETDITPEIKKIIYDIYSTC